VKHAEYFWRLQRLSGIVAMCCLGMAFIALFDGLRTGIFGSADIRLIPGEEYEVSGPMPPKTEHIEDFVLEGSSADTVQLLPENVFTGYWLGGSMWRGRILASDNARPGEYVILVRDKFGEKQNPALIFQVRTFADEAARRAASPSLFMRWADLNAYWAAVILAVLGLSAGGANLLLGKKWHAALQAHGCGEIFRLLKVDDHCEAAIEVHLGSRIPIGTVYTFRHPVRGELGQGRVVACGKGEITIAFASELPVQLGDVACPES
jgi:hypothetical protein